MAGSVRMADIAERLGISVVSVSKGLSGKDGVSSELRSRILATAREMGYVDAKRARELMPEQNIGILVADRFFNENAFYYNLYRDLLTFSQEQNLAVLLEIVTNEAEWACKLPSLVKMNRVHGLILMGEFSMLYVRAVTGCGLPFVLLDSSKDDLEADSVVSDNVRGGYKLTRFLLEQGRKKDRLCRQHRDDPFDHGAVPGLLQGAVRTRHAAQSPVAVGGQERHGRHVRPHRAARGTAGRVRVQLRRDRLQPLRLPVGAGHPRAGGRGGHGL